MPAHLPHTYRTATGTYYLRLIWPKAVLGFLPSISSIFRCSLKTKERSVAKHRAFAHINFFNELIASVLKYEYFKKELTEHEANIMARGVVSYLKGFVEKDSSMFLKSITHQSNSGSEVRFDYGSADQDLEALLKYLKMMGEYTEISEVHSVSRPAAVSGVLEESASGNGGEIKGYSVRELADDFLQDRLVAGKWKDEKTLQINVGRINAIVEIIGKDKIVGSLKKSDIVDVKKTLRQYPARRNLGHSASESLQVLMARDTYARISPNTAKAYFEICQSLIRFAYSNDDLEKDIARDIDFPAETLEEDEKHPFDPADLKAIVNGYMYTADYTGSKRQFLSAHFWVPLMAMYTGARLNELCQLGVADIQCEGHIWYFNITDEDEHQNLKRKSSKRKVPIHSQLLEFGFIGYWESRKALVGDASNTMLFEGLEYEKGSRWGRKVGRWYNGDGEAKANGYLDTVQIKNRGNKSFHSHRHTVIDLLRNAGVEEARIAAIVGHENASMTSNYGRGFNIQSLSTEIEKIRYDMDMEHVDYPRFLRMKDDFSPRQRRTHRVKRKQPIRKAKDAA
uniref:site-specific integrase n=1 Tax=Marinobacterium profundum TaxID=1714300 RepID=UPI00083111BB|nr:site-specific integrase [Marinobacterium profundum]